MYSFILPNESTKHIHTIELKTSYQGSKDVDIHCHYVTCEDFKYCIYCCRKRRSIFCSARQTNG